MYWHFLHGRQECGHLLRPIKLNMHLFGDEISREVDGEHQSLHNLTFHLHSGLYHECHPQKLAMPDIVVGNHINYCV